jgi:hypothetical protein
MRQYICAGITFFRFSFYLSVSILSAISVSQSLHLPPHLDLPCHLDIPRHLHLHLLTLSISNLPPLHRKTLNFYNRGEHFAAFCLFMGTSPKNCGLLGGNGNKLKLKTTAKLKDKRTSIATVRGLVRMYATFPGRENGKPFFTVYLTSKGGATAMIF